LPEYESACLVSVNGRVSLSFVCGVLDTHHVLLSVTL
jgi:hypothetical protein